MGSEKATRPNMTRARALAAAILDSHMVERGEEEVAAQAIQDLASEQTRELREENERLARVARPLRDIVKALAARRRTEAVPPGGLTHDQLTALVLEFDVALTQPKEQSQ